MIAMGVPGCYCPDCAEAILDAIDPLLDPDVFGVITEARVDDGGFPCIPY